MKNKKLVLSLGASLLVAMPLATAISCDSNTDTTKPEMTFEEYVDSLNISVTGTGLQYRVIDAFVDANNGEVTIDSQEKANQIKNNLGLANFHIGTIPSGYSIRAEITKAPVVDFRQKKYDLKVVVNGKNEGESEEFTSIAYSSDYFNPVSFSTYVDTISFRAPEVARKTYQHLDSFFDNNPGEVIIDEQNQADVFKEELGLDMFEIGNKPEDYRITVVLSKVTPLPNANKRYTIALRVYGSIESEFFTKTETIRSTNVYGDEAIADANKVAEIKAAFGTPTSTNNKTIAQLDEAKTASISSSELTSQVLSTVGITATIPTALQGVTIAYSITKGLMQNNQRVPYTFRIHLKLNDAEDMIVTEILSFDNYVAPVTDAEDVANLKTAIGTPVASNTKTISEIESIASTGNYTFTQFEMFGITANVPTDRNGVSLTYQVIGGEKVHNQKVNYTVKLILTKNGTSDFIAIALQSSNIYISPEADQNDVEALKTQIGTITSANDKTIAQIEAVATSGSYSSALFTSLGLTGTIPSNLNGATLTYVIERSPRLVGEKVNYGFNLYITKGNATAIIIVHIQSSDLYIVGNPGDSEQLLKVKAEKANFDSIYGAQYNEDAISVLPQDGEGYITTNGIFTREYIEADEDVSADYAVKALDEYTVELTVVFSLWGDFEKTTTATSTVIITYRMVMFEVLVEREVDRIDTADEAGVVNTYPNAASILPSSLPNRLTTNNNFAGFTSSITADPRFTYKFIIEDKDDINGEIYIWVEIWYTGFKATANDAYITLRGFKTL